MGIYMSTWRGARLNVVYSKFIHRACKKTFVWFTRKACNIFYNLIYMQVYSVIVAICSQYYLFHVSLVLGTMEVYN